MPLTNVPLPGQTLGQTRDLIAGNFTSIGNAFVVDHIDYAITNAGKHNQITFPNHTGAISFASGEIGLFNQNTAPTSRPEIWLQRGTASTGANPFPMTGAGFSETGWTYLPSGILMKWGLVSVGSAGSNIPYNAIQGPSYNASGTNVYSVILTSATLGVSFALVTRSSMPLPNTFTFNSSGIGGMWYLMIGSS